MNKEEIIAIIKSAIYNISHKLEQLNYLMENLQKL